MSNLPVEDNLMSKSKLEGQISRNEKFRKINVKEGKMAYAHLMSIASEAPSE